MMIKRYKIYESNYHTVEEESPDGKWVKFQDIKDLADEVCISCEEELNLFLKGEE